MGYIHAKCSTNDMSGSISNQFPNTYLRQFFRYLGSRQELLHDTEETAYSLAQLGGNNSFRDYCQFFRNARALFDEPDIGLTLGRVNQLANMHGPVSTALYQSSDVRDCLELLQRFTPLRLPAIHTRWVEEEQHIGLEIEFREQAGDIHNSVTETLLLSITNVISVVSQGNVHPSRIELDYPRPAYAQSYREAFKVAAIRFDRPHIRMLVSRAESSYRTDTDADPLLRATAIERCEELLRGALDAPSTSDRIRQVFADNPGHLWTLKDIARHLNTSQRTLQRRLSVEDSSYQLLYNEWLKSEARQLLLEENLSVESIAMLLGYSDVSNFRQACHRWYGSAPIDLRHSFAGTG